MDLSKTKLAKQNAPLVQELSDIMTEAEGLGVQRIALICDQYDKLSPEVAYQRIDPIGLQDEIEEAQGHKIEILHIIRNSVSVLPLILTWFALFVATDTYQKDTYAGDAGKPGGADNFSQAGRADSVAAEVYHVLDVPGQQKFVFCHIVYRDDLFTMLQPSNTVVIDIYFFSQSVGGC